MFYAFFSSSILVLGRIIFAICMCQKIFFSSGLLPIECWHFSFLFALLPLLLVVEFTPENQEMNIMRTNESIIKNIYMFHNSTIFIDNGDTPCVKFVRTRSSITRTRAVWAAERCVYYVDLIMRKPPTI